MCGVAPAAAYLSDLCIPATAASTAPVVRSDDDDDDDDDEIATHEHADDQKACERVRKLFQRPRTQPYVQLRTRTRTRLTDFVNYTYAMNANKAAIFEFLVIV